MYNTYIYNMLINYSVWTKNVFNGEVEYFMRIYMYLSAHKYENYNVRMCITGTKIENVMECI